MIKETVIRGHLDNIRISGLITHMADQHYRVTLQAHRMEREADGLNISSMGQRHELVWWEENGTEGCETRQEAINRCRDAVENNCAEVLWDKSEQENK